MCMNLTEKQVGVGCGVWSLQGRNGVSLMRWWNPVRTVVSGDSAMNILTFGRMSGCALSHNIWADQKETWLLCLSVFFLFCAESIFTRPFSYARICCRAAVPMQWSRTPWNPWRCWTRRRNQSTSPGTFLATWCSSRLALNSTSRTVSWRVGPITTRPMWVYLLFSRRWWRVFY